MSGTTRKTAEVFPVGEFIREVMEAEGITIRQLAMRLGGDFRLNYLGLEVLLYAPRKGLLLDAEMASRLSRILGGSPEFWLNLDRTWQEHES